MKNRLFLKGSGKSGKTALLIRGLSDLRVISGGYALITLEKDGQKLPALVEPCQAAAAELPYDFFPECVYNSAGFIADYGKIMDSVLEKDMGCLDPILGAELSDSEALARLKTLLNGETAVMGVIAGKEFAGDKNEYDKILDFLSQDENTLIIDTDAVNSEEACAMMRQWAEAVLDAAHHKKFDPQMKLRARRKRPAFRPAD